MGPFCPKDIVSMSEFCGGNHKRGRKQNFLRLVGEKKRGGGGNWLEDFGGGTNPLEDTMKDGSP